MYKFEVSTIGMSDVRHFHKFCKNYFEKPLSLEETEKLVKESLCTDSEIIFLVSHSKHLVGYVYLKEIAPFSEPRYVEIVDIAGYDHYINEGGLYEMLLDVSEKWAQQLCAQRIIFPVKKYNIEKYGDFEKKNYTKDDHSLFFTKKLM